MKSKSNMKNKDFVWYGTRVLFWIISVLFVLLIIFSSTLYDISDIFYKINLGVWLFFNLFLFVLSIIHLSLYSQKAFAIVSLIFSSIGILLGLVSFFAFTFVGIVNNNLAEGMILLNDSDTLKADYYVSYYLDLPAESSISLNLSTTRLVDAWFLEESEYGRFSDNSTDETWYYMQKASNITNWNLTDYWIEIPGRYRVLISNSDPVNSLDYKLLVTQRVSLSDLR